MQIRLNEQPVDVTLEDEKTLGPVVSAMARWLADSGLALTAAEADGRELDLEETQDWVNRDLASIAHLDLKANRPDDMRRDLIETMREYFTLLDAALENGQESEIRPLTAQYAEVRSALPMALNEQSSSGRDSFRHLERAIASEELIWSADYRSEARRHVTRILEFLRTRSREYDRPLREALGTARLLESILPKVSDVAILLQSGKDREAMQIVLHFTELLTKLTRLVPLVIVEHPELDSTRINGKSADDLASDLNSMLEELAQAFESRDSVLIGDLLEYEIPPRVEDFMAYLREAETNT